MIPGMSLTGKLGNAAWEKEPQINNPEEALNLHLSRLAEPEKMQAVMEALETGVDIKTITEGITRSAVMNGIHSIDVSLLVAPVIHEMIKSNADVLGVEYDEGFDEDAERAKAYGERMSVIKAKKELQKFRDDNDIANVELDEAPEVSVDEPVEEAPMGLMQRRGV